MACALGYHVLSRLSDEAFVANVKETGAYLRARLEFCAHEYLKYVAGSSVRLRLPADLQ